MCRKKEKQIIKEIRKGIESKKCDWLERKNKNVGGSQNILRMYLYGFLFYSKYYVCDVIFFLTSEKYDCYMCAFIASDILC